jgi:glycosyltransferase involved in cell wall biosynthesis
VASEPGPIKITPCCDSSMRRRTRILSSACRRRHRQRPGDAATEKRAYTLWWCAHLRRIRDPHLQSVKFPTFCSAALQSASTPVAVVVMVNACVLNSQRWLHARLTESAAGSGAVAWTTDPGSAEIIIYPVPPWRDPHAPQRLSALPPHLWSRLFLFSQDDNPALWAPGVFASVSASHPDAARARGGFYVHHANYEPEHTLALQPRSHDAVEYLWSFVGSVSTWPAVRGPLLALEDDRALKLNTADWREHHRWQLDGPRRTERSNALANYAETLHKAKFVVCPRGIGASSARLFEAMRVGRCPVIVSDDWLPPPFVDWESCAIRIPESEMHHLPAMLREREQDATVLGLRARSVWEQRYSPRSMLNTLVEACLDISPRQKRPGPRLRMIARSVTTREAARKLKSGITGAFSQ